jgi:hypothetical protein
MEEFNYINSLLGEPVAWLSTKFSSVINVFRPLRELKYNEDRVGPKAASRLEEPIFLREVRSFAMCIAPANDTQ